MDCSSANKGNLIPGMLSAPGMVPAAASSRDRTSKSLALPEARSKRSSEKETVGTGKEDIKDLRARGSQDTCCLCTPLPGSFPARCSCLRTAATAHAGLSTNSPTQGTSLHLTLEYASHSNPAPHSHPRGFSRYLQPWFQQQHLCDSDAELQPETSPSPSQSPEPEVRAWPLEYTHTHTESDSTCW